jgi:phosphatidylglycerol:prolipoprotein diacylglycerol transferase
MALPFPDMPIGFPKMGPFQLGDWTVGPFQIRFYALAYIAGILLGWRYAVGLVRNGRLWGGRPATMTSLQIDDLIVWVTLGVILGGRIGYVLFYMLPLEAGRQAMAADWTVVFRVWEGGMSFHGGMLGVLIAMAGFCWRNKLSLLGVADIIVACEPIGQFFGRLANFINGELWGRQTDVPWAMVFCNETIRGQNGGTCPAGEAARHPSQLYEAGLEGLALFLILRWATHRAGWLQRHGAVSGLFLIGYGVFRTALETVRNPDQGLDQLPYGLTVGMMLSVPMVLGGAFLIWRALKQPLPPPADAAPPETPDAEAHEPA